MISTLGERPNRTDCTSSTILLANNEGGGERSDCSILAVILEPGCEWPRGALATCSIRHLVKIVGSSQAGYALHDPSLSLGARGSVLSI